jgi:hypothetical protein
MALNLWKTGGKPTSYSSLPTGDYVNVNQIGVYVVSFYAKSASSAVLWVQDSSQAKLQQTLTPNRTFYTVTVTNPTLGRIYILDRNGIGDIVVDSIQLVQKPLPKLTINGLDGFNSGKWVLDSHATVVDDETLVLNATADYQTSYLYIPVLPNQTFTVSYGGNMECAVDAQDVNKGQISQVLAWGLSGRSFTVPANTYFLKFWFGNKYERGTLTVNKPMLNMGSIPPPYSKKTGDRMVMPTAKKNLLNLMDLESGSFSVTGAPITHATAYRTKNFIAVKPNATCTFSKLDTSIKWWTIHAFKSDGTWKSQLLDTQSNSGSVMIPSDVSFIKMKFDDGLAIVNAQPQLEQNTVATAYEPYNVQVNKKPQKYVPKKNLFDGQLYTDGTSAKSNIIYLDSSKTYIFTNGYSQAIAVYDLQGNGIVVANPNESKSFSGYLAVKIGRSSSVNLTLNNSQLEQGSTATPYEPYQLILPPSKKGLSFNGITDYLQLPSMTMDAIEIECLIDANQPSSSRYLFDTRSGSSNGWVNQSSGYNFSCGIDISSVYENGVSKQNLGNMTLTTETRTKIKANFNQSFTDNVNIFSRYTNVEFLKGILYKVTCYLAGNIVAQYDFENNQNLVGSSMIPNAQNLIPSFEDGGWNIHPNAKVLGKDVLHLDASADNQPSTIFINVLPNTNYIIACNHNAKISVYGNQSNTYPLVSSSVQQATFNSGVNTSLNIALRNTGLGAGSFDFIKPQLYQLSGKEGTIYGSPTQQNKGSKRSKYSIR